MTDLERLKAAYYDARDAYDVAIDARDAALAAEAAALAAYYDAVTRCAADAYNALAAQEKETDR